VFLPDPALGDYNLESEHIRLQMAASTTVDRGCPRSSSTQACVSPLTFSMQELIRHHDPAADIIILFAGFTSHHSKGTTLHNLKLRSHCHAVGRSIRAII